MQLTGRAVLLYSLLAIAASAANAATSGTFSNIAFNVAGLPALLQGNGVPGDKATVAGLIGSYFAKYGYDLIHLQEDFNYHAYIYATDNHPYRTSTSGGAGIGSGLNTLSNFPWYNFERIQWNDCNGITGDGNDCLTPKGFTHMRIRVDEGVIISAYNLHADAGSTDADGTARSKNIQQVIDHINTWAVGAPVIIIGDTNCRYTRAIDNIREFQYQTGLNDAWVQRIRGGVYPTKGSDAIVCASNPSSIQTCEVVDKILYRSSPAIQLTATHFEYVGYKFLQADGSITADHDPILVNTTWSFRDNFRQSDLFGGPHGTWFNDLPSIPVPAKTHKLIFRGNARVDNVGVVLTTGQAFKHGGTGGNEATLTLGATEFWTSAYICTAKYNGNTRLYYIRATTSSGRTLAVGATTSDCVTYSAPSGYQIVGFYGRSGDEVDMLGLIYLPQVGPVPVVSTGWFRLASSAEPTKCLDFPLGSGAGTRLQMWDCNGVGVQQFTYQNGQLVNRLTGWCLDLSNNNRALGTAVGLYPCYAGAAQAWTLEQRANQFRLRLNGTNLCLNNLNFATANGSPIGLWDCYDDTATLFIAQNEHDLYRPMLLKSSLDTNQCIDFPIGAARSTQLMTYSCNGQLNQKFSYRNGQLINESNQLCLDVLNNALVAGQPVLLYDCTGVAGQKWTLRADTSTGASQLRVTGTSLCLSVPNGAYSTSLLYLKACATGDKSVSWILA